MEEQNYLNLLSEILENGNKKDDRTKTGTYSLFGKSMKFDLSNNTFPLLTTKKVNFRLIVEELLWFLRGSTNNQELRDVNVNIWNSNSSRSFLDSLGFFERKENDIGPGYGFQWRHFGAKYIDCFTDYTGQGIDQIEFIINEIKNNPDSRRIILSGWNPMDLEKSNLPPCHCLAQFYVNGNDLSCHLYQRSGDMALGVPFNIASYSLLTFIIADITNLKPKEFIHTIGDAHIYSNHVEGVKEQLKRKPLGFPKLYFTKSYDKPEKYKFEDIELLNYNCHDIISFKMAI